MDNILQKAKKIHFIGIGGIGMSGLAHILHEKGKSVSGSDQADSAIIKDLRKEKMKIHIGHEETNIQDDTDLVIASHAIDEKNIELQYARKKGIPVLSYPSAVGQLTQEYFTICIAGTHGKTTVTSMLTHILLKANLDPTVIVGTKLQELDNKSSRLGKSKYFILESCEYKRSFLHYKPDIIALTNIDLDHLDYYKDEKDYIRAFEELIEKMDEEGKVIYNAEDKNSKSAIERTDPIHYGISDIDTMESFYIKENKIFEKGAKVAQCELKIPGKHNRRNALLAFAVARQLHLDPETIAKALQNFSGSWRRFEQKGYIGNTVIIDDYGHHPTEIQATLQAARERFQDKKILCVFQPHQFSRTKFFLEQFSQSFKDADAVLIPNIYQARDSEEDIKSVSAEKLADLIEKEGTKTFLGKDIKTTLHWLKTHHAEYDVIMTMGAGDVYKIAEELAK